MDEVQFPLLIIAVSLAVALGTGIFKLAGLRARVHEKWSGQVGVTKGGLEAIATRELYSIYSHVRMNLDADEQFRRDQMPFQPFVLDDKVRQYAQSIRHWRNIDKRIAQLLWIGPILIALLSFAYGPTLLLGLYALGQLQSGVVQLVGIAFGIGVVVLLASVLVAYTILEHRLTTAQIFGEKASTA